MSPSLVRDGWSGDLGPETARADAVTAVRRAFRDAGLDSPALDARLLVAAALRIDAIELLARPEAPLGTDAGRLAAFVRRRLDREPVARILGEREFWGLPFALSPETLVPRPETETVVETALARIRDRHAPLRLLDLGTGSGCLLVALLREMPRAIGVGLDRSFGALATARCNAGRNGVAPRSLFLASDWAAAVSDRFDLVVSNPPYIASPALAGLDLEVRAHDPPAALDGGVDGLEAYRAILRDAHRLLAPDGVMVLEIAFDQEASVSGLAVQAGLQVVATARDLAGHLRAIALERVEGMVETGAAMS